MKHAVVVDDGFEAALMSDVCFREAQKYHDRWASSNSRSAVQRNLQKHEIFNKYAARFEHIRLQEVERMKETLMGTES